jgi:hypothetical protein
MVSYNVSFFISFNKELLQLNNASLKSEGRVAFLYSFAGEGVRGEVENLTRDEACIQ